MMIDEILKVTENLKSLYSCENCKEPCDVPYKIKLCGHIHCKKCISAANKCFKCDTKFVVDDIFADSSLGTIFNSINILASVLQRHNAKTGNTLASSCVVLQSEQLESNYIFDSDPTDDRLINFNCDCSNYIEFKDKTDTTELIDKKNAVGETKLHRACKKGNEVEVNTLLNAGASVNAQDFANWTPLHEAVIVENNRIVEWLVQKGSVVNAPGYNYETPLHKAIIQKNIDIAQFLVKNGANLYSKNYEGISPWDLADSDMKYTLNSIKCGSISLKIPIKTQQYNLFIIGKITEDLESNINKLTKLDTINVLSDLNEHVTHVILVSSSKVVKPSYDLLLAILYCIPIVTTEWLEACLTQRARLSCKEYFIIGTEQFKCDVIQRTQMNKYKLNPKLFSGCNIFLGKGSGKFLLSDTDIVLDTNQVRRLVTVGGGTLLKREPLPGAISGSQQPWHAAAAASLKYCAHYVLYDPAAEPALRYNMRELRHVPYQWIFESILRYQLVEPDKLLCNKN